VQDKIDQLQDKVYTIDTKVSVLEEHSKNQTTLMQEMKIALNDINKTLQIYQVLKHDFDIHVQDNTVFAQKFYLAQDNISAISADVKDLKENRDKNFKKMSRVIWIVVGTAIPATIFGAVNVFFELVRRGLIK